MGIQPQQSPGKSSMLQSDLPGCVSIDLPRNASGMLDKQSIALAVLGSACAFLNVNPYSWSFWCVWGAIPQPHKNPVLPFSKGVSCPCHIIAAKVTKLGEIMLLEGHIICCTGKGGGKLVQTEFLKIPGPSRYLLKCSGHQVLCLTTS